MADEQRKPPTGLSPRDQADLERLRELQGTPRVPEPEPVPLLRPDMSQFDPSKPGFDTTTFLSQKGVKVIAPGSERGRLIVEDDRTGERKEIEVANVLQQEGLAPDQFNYMLNRPETALPTSPLSIAERFQVIGLGNRRGQVSWLRNNFEDVAEIPESRDLVVKKDGVWHRIDGQAFSTPDAWEWTKEVVADIADVVPEIVVGTEIGLVAAVSGPLVLKAAPLIGAGGEIMRTSLGRLAGTYEATVDEQVADVAVETVLALGGEGVVLGAKPIFKQIFKAVKNINRGASDATKGMISQILGVMNKTGPRATDELFKNPIKMQNTINRFMDQASKTLRKSKFSQETIDESRRLMGKEMERNFADFSRMAGKSLSKTWTEGTERILKNVPEDASFNLKETGTSLLQTMEQMGFGQIKKTSEGALKFKTFTKSEIRKNLEELTGTQASTFTQQQLDAVAPLIAELQDLAASSTLKGRAGAKQLMEDRGSLSKLITNIGDEYPQIKAPLEQIRESLDSQISKGLTIITVGRTGAAQRVIKTDTAIRQFESLRKRWAAMADDLKAVKAVAPGDKEVPTMQALMTDSPVRSRQLRDAMAGAIRSMDEAGVKGGQKIMDRMIHIEASSKYIDWYPRADKIQGIGAATIAYGSGFTGIFPAFIASTSPALGRRMAIGMSGVSNLLKTLSPSQISRVLENDIAMRNLIQGTVRSVFEGEQLARELEGQLQDLRQLQETGAQQGAAQSQQQAQQ